MEIRYTQRVPIKGNLPWEEFDKFPITQPRWRTCFWILPCLTTTIWATAMCCTLLLAHCRRGTFCDEEHFRLRGQKFHTDDINQCFHNKSGSHGVPNANLFNFTFLLVDFGKVLCLSANELQQKSNATSREYYIPQILTVLLKIHHVYIWPLWSLSFVCHL